MDSRRRTLLFRRLAFRCITAATVFIATSLAAQIDPDPLPSDGDADTLPDTVFEPKPGATDPRFFGQYCSSSGETLCEAKGDTSEHHADREEKTMAPELVVGLANAGWFILKTGIFDGMRGIDVLVDDVKQTTMKFGEVATVEVPAGELRVQVVSHQLRASNVVTVVATDRFPARVHGKYSRLWGRIKLTT